MRGRWEAVVLVAGTLVLGACDAGGEGGGDDGAVNQDRGSEATMPGDDGGGSGDEFQVRLAEDSGSGLQGTATFTPDGDRTHVQVVLQAEGGDAEQGGTAHPAHVHEGTCDDFEPAPAFPLEDVVDGRSETTIDASMDELRDQELVVNVHRSAERIEEYVACGELP